MNLGSSVGVQQKRDPLWKQALATFLAQSAGSAASGLTANALEKDYQAEAVRQGIISADTPERGFGEKLTQGAAWDKSRLNEALKDKSDTAREARQTEEFAARMGLSRDEFEALKEERTRQAGLDERRLGQTDRQLGQGDTRLSQDESYRRDSLDQQAKLRNDAIQARLDEINARQNDPNRALDLTKKQAEIDKLKYESNPERMGTEKAYQMQKLMELMGIQPNTGGAPTGKPTTPTDAVSKREAANRAPTAAIPGQTGQAPNMPSPDSLRFGQPSDGRPLSQNDVSPPADIMSLVAPTGGPDSVSPQLATAANNPAALMQDPEIAKRAAMLAKLLSTQGGVGGAPIGNTV